MNNNYWEYGMHGANRFGNGFAGGFENMPWFFAPSVFIGLSILGFILLIVFLVSVVLKGYALWTASKRDEKWWFIILLVVNTMGILEIIYLLFVAKIPFFKRGKCVCEKCGKSCVCDNTDCKHCNSCKIENIEDNKTEEKAE